MFSFFVQLYMFACARRLDRFSLLCFASSLSLLSRTGNVTAPIRAGRRARERERLFRAVTSMSGGEGAQPCEPTTTSRCALQLSHTEQLSPAYDHHHHTRDNSFSRVTTFYYYFFLSAPLFSTSQYRAPLPRPTVVYPLFIPRIYILCFVRTMFSVLFFFICYRSDSFVLCASTFSFRWFLASRSKKIKKRDMARASLFPAKKTSMICVRLLFAVLFCVPSCASVRGLIKVQKREEKNSLIFYTFLYLREWEGITLHQCASLSPSLFSIQGNPSKGHYYQQQQQAPHIFARTCDKREKR